MFAIVLLEVNDSGEGGRTTAGHVERELRPQIESAGYKLVGSRVSETIDDLPTGSQIMSHEASR